MCLFITISCVCIRYVYIYHTRDSDISSSSIYFLITRKLSHPSWQDARLPQPQEEKEKRELRGTYWGRNGDERESREDVHFSKEQSYITAREKRPSTGRLISKALPPAPFTSSPNPRALHEFRHSEPNPSHHSLYLSRLTTARHDEKRRRVQSSL